MADWKTWLTEEERRQFETADCYGCEPARTIAMELFPSLAASRALVGELKPYVQHLCSSTGACRENFCYCGAADVLALDEADMLKRMVSDGKFAKGQP